MTEVNLEDVSSVFLSESSTEIRKRMKSGELKIAVYGLGHAPTVPEPYFRKFDADFVVCPLSHTDHLWSNSIPKYVTY